MKVGVIINGSRGDIQPYVALSHALAAAGHDVALTANVDAADLAAAANIRFVPMDLDTRAWLSAPEGQRALANGKPPALLDGANKWLSDALDSIVDGILDVAEEADLLIAGAQMDDYVVPFGEVRRLPVVMGYLTPWLPTDEFPQVLVSRARLRPRPLARQWNRYTYRKLERIYWRGKHEAVNKLRRSLGLPRARASMLTLATPVDAPVLHAYSSMVVSRPPEWGPRSVLTGYWRLAADVRKRLGESDPPARLVDWLDSGPPPVFLGFGSMPILDPGPVLEMAIEAARRARTRVLIGAGWTEFAGAAGGLPEYVQITDAVDHDWLFPRCQAVVHHGGTGTTGAGLTAGRPTWIFSMFMDQPYWGSRVERLGVGGYDRFTRLSVRTLSTALDVLSRADVQQRADALGGRLRAEDGVANAVRALTGTTVLARR